VGICSNEEKDEKGKKTIYSNPYADIGSSVIPS